ncbi:MAG: cysteine--tRNA ligase [Trueperaceae bacterium]|nr:cysteine--tRNA ligase [Trueperaceae bacterium]
MPIQFYNSYTRTLETFTPAEPGLVRMYNCGPTVYSDPHIGNLRSFLFADVLRRTLERRGLRVQQVMNITDVGHLVDDGDAGPSKIDEAARREKKDPWEITRHYGGVFLDMLRQMNFRPIDVHPKATEHIPEMIAMIERLIEKGYAYVVNHAVYFDITRFPQYGRLSNNTTEQLQAGARVEVHSDKRNPIDFALWKYDPHHLMQWDSPWGRGFPGWHIECSAMSQKYLGETFDIHTGGEDNIFPHHECEIAQSECANGKPFVRYWLHARHLLVNGEKMSKSKGNFFTVKNILDKGYSPRVLRYLLVSVHYRIPLNFTFEGLEGARSALQRMEAFRSRLDATAPSSTPAPDLVTRMQGFRDRMEAGLDDDLNVSEMLGDAFTMINEVNRLLDENKVDAAGLQQARELLQAVEDVTGVRIKDEAGLAPEDQALFDARAEARKRKEWKESDRLRDALKARGILVEDIPGGQRWKRGV